MKEQWIIGICNTDCDGVKLVGFCGTEDEVKAKLVRMVKEGAKNDKERWDYGTASTKEVEKDYLGNWYAFGNYSCYHIDYSAKRLKDIL